ARLAGRAQSRVRRSGRRADSMGNAADTARDAAILRARRPWGGQVSFRDIDAAPPPPPAQPWTLVGTIVRDDRRFALIQIGPRGTGKLEYMGVGDKLPDGSRVEEINT